MSRPAKIIIDLAAIQANFCLAQQLAPDSKTMAVVKADAYGHGAERVAKALEPQVEMLAVSCFEEALTLRDTGILKPILLLEGCFSREEIALAAEQNCQLVIHSWQQIAQLECVNIDHAITVWLKVDTGMHRLGVIPDEVEKAYLKLEACKNVKDVLLMSHFSSADNLVSASTSEQMKCFEGCMSSIQSEKPALSLANSAGILAWPQSRKEWNRPGIMLYGLSPFSESQPEADKLQPAMNFQSEVMAVRQIAQGESVGYGDTWTAQRTSLIASIAVGYGDGYPRTAKSGTPVLINGQRAPLVGRVSMDLISVDVTGVSQVNIGDTVILWGKESYAEACG